MVQYIEEAVQLIRFQLDDSGAILESDAAVVMLNGDEPPPEPRRFVFDRPFLLYLQQRQAKQPYFVMWVENPDVLVPDPVSNADAASANNGKANESWEYPPRPKRRARPVRPQSAGETN